MVITSFKITLKTNSQHGYHIIQNKICHYFLCVAKTNNSVTSCTRLQSSSHCICSGVGNLVFHSICSGVSNLLFHSICRGSSNLVFHSLCSGVSNLVFHSICSGGSNLVFHSICNGVSFYL